MHCPPRKENPTIFLSLLSLLSAGFAALAVVLSLTVVLRVLPRFALVLAPLATVAALLAIPADEARADSGHPAESQGEIFSLHYAAGYNGDLAAVIHLLGSAHGIDVNAEAPNWGFDFWPDPSLSGVYLDGTPLHYAAYYGRWNIAATLIAEGARVDAETSPSTGRHRPIHYAAQHGHNSVVSVLIAAGADVNAKNYTGRTPLYLAAGRGRASVVSLLLAAGASARNEAIYLAAGRGHASVVSLLLAAGASARNEAICRLGFTPDRLYDSVAKECIPFSAQVCEGLTPPKFYDATAGECEPFVECHATAMPNADNSGCECAPGDYAHGDPAVAECHADHAPLAHDPNGWTAAITLDNPEIVSHFITDHGQDPDANYALHLAARHSAFGIAKLLLQRGANPDAVNSNGDTPLHLAARLSDSPENVALVSLLLDKGADPNIRNNARWRPLDLAFEKIASLPPRRRMMAALLIAWGARWSDECPGGAIPNENHYPEFTTPLCVCPPHISEFNGSRVKCECPAHSHAQVNGRCLAKDSAQVQLEIEKMRLELERLRLELAALNLQLSLAADGPPEMLEEVAKQAEVAARGIAQRRNNFLALARAGLAEADDAGPAPTLALSDTEATCRMLDGEVQTHSRTGMKICSGIDHNDTFCIVGSASAFPCVGFFRHVRQCNDDHNRPALDPWHCAKQCADGLRARGAKCQAE